MKKIYFASTKKIILIFFAILANFFFFSTVIAQATGDYRSVGGPWTTRGSWQRWNGGAWATPTTGQGYPGEFSTPATVTILDGDAITLNVSPAFSIGSLVIQAGTNASSITYTTAFSLTVNNAITIGAGTGSGDTKYINVATGTLSAASVSVAATGSGTRPAGITLTTGTVNISGNIAMSDAFGVVTFTGAGGTLNLGGNFTGGTLTPANGTVNCNGATAQTFGTTSPSSFYNLTINKTAAANTVTSNGAAFQVANNLTVTTGNLIYSSTTADYNVGNDLSIAANGTLTHNVLWGTTLLRITGNFINNGTFSHPPARSHVQMNGTNKTISMGASDLSIFTLANTSGAITAAGTLTITDNFWAAFGVAGGSFAIPAGVTVNANAALLNNGGTVLINGGALNVTGGINVGVANNSSLTGSIKLSSGTLTTDGITVGALATSGPAQAAASGTFTHSGGIANINGSLLINPLGNYTCNTSSDINISGDWTNNGTFTPTGSTVTFNNTAAAQTISGTAANPSFNNLVIAKSAQSLNVAGGALTNTNIIGNWTNTSGTFVPSTGRVTFGGTALQNVNGPVVTDFNNVTIANGANVTLNTDVRINGAAAALIFSSGKIITGVNKVILGNSATSTGAAAGRYVFGNIQAGIATGATTRTFDIGDATVYAPVTTALIGVTNATGSITASTTSGQEPNIASALIDETQDVNRYYTLQNNAVTLTSYNPTFTFVAGDVIGGANPANFIVGLYNAGWSYPAVGSKTAVSTQATGVTNFGNFAIGIAATVPTINTNPASQPGCVNSSVVFTAKANNNPASTVIWELSTDGVTFNPFTITGIYSVSTTTAAGVTTSSLTINPLSIGLNGYKYRAHFTNSKGNITSADATLTVNTLPALFNVTGGGGYCTGGSGVVVGLDGSETGVNYQLKNGAANVGAPVAGTGSAISFGSQPGTVTYTVQATGPNCSVLMTGNATVTLNPLPTAFTVTITNSGAYCIGGTGVTIGVANSQTGVSYQLFQGATPSGTAVNGTGSAISFGLRTTAGNYTVTATNSTTTCTNNMSNSVTVTINPLPLIFNVTGGGAYCSGGTGVAIGLDGSSTGVSYQLFLGATPSGAAVSGTGAAISFGSRTGAGTYTVTATNTTTFCQVAMSGNAVVSINALPLAYAVTGGGAYCAGGTGTSIGLANSQTGVSYQLFLGATPIGAPLTGTGAALNFGLQTTVGTYTVTATNTTTLCTNAMTGNAVVSTNALPTSLSATANPGAICIGGTSVLTGNATTTATGTTYSENFNGTSTFVVNPTGTTGTAGNQSENWAQENSGTTVNTVTTFTSPGGGKLMVTTCGRTTNGTSSVTSSTLTSASINTTAYSTLTLTFNHTYKDGSSSGNGVLEASSDNFITSTVLATYNGTVGTSAGFAGASFNLNSFINQANLKVRFTFSSVNTGTGNKSWWAVDDVAINGNLVPLYSWTANTAPAVNGLPANAGTPLASNKSITVDPTSTTIYNLTVEDPALHCPTTLSSATTVTVNPLPVPTISGPTVACLNIANTYTYSTESGKTGYTWNANGGNITAGAGTNTVTVTWTTGGSRSISVNYTQTGCTAATPTSYAVTVNGSTPAFTAGATAICQTSSSTYIVQPGKTNYVWTTNGGTITAGGTSADNTATIQWNVAGTRSVSVNYTDNACSAPTATVRTVTVSPIAVVNPGTPLTVCSNVPSNITGGATASNYNDVTWTTNGDGAFDNETSLTNALYAPGPNDIAAGSVTINLTATPNAGCTADVTASKLITISNAATATAGTVVNTCSTDGPVNITAGSSVTNATAVSWTSSGTGVFTNANSLTLATYAPSAADKAAGFVTLILTATGTSPCGSATSTKFLSITNPPTGVTVTPSAITICLGSNTALTASATTSSLTAITPGSENFNLTPSYIVSGNTNGIAGSSKVWTQVNSGYNDFLVANYISPDGSKLMITTCADFLFANTKSELTSPIINTTNYSSLTLSYQHSFKKGASGSAQLQGSINNGPWNALATYTNTVGSAGALATETISAATLAPYAGQANVKFRFAYDVSVNFLQTQTSWWALDNVVLNGTQIPLYSWTANTPAGVNGLPAGAGTPSVGNKNITVAPTQTTTYTVTASDQVGSCTSAAATSTVTVNQPATAAISGTTTICRGNTTTITFTATPNTTVTYTINGGSPLTIPVGPSGVATLTTAALIANTTYALVSVAYTTAPGCSQVAAGTAVVTVNQIATASISGATTICTGSSATITFTATPNTTVTYTVNGGANQTIAIGAGGTATLSTGVLIASATYTLVSVAYTTAPGCSQSANGTVTVTVRPTATVAITGTATICSASGTDITFTGTPNTTVTYNIDGGSPLTIAIGPGGTATLPTGPLTVATTYNLVSIAYTAVPGCSVAASGSVTISINAPATASISGATTICEGSSATITFTATPNTTVGYQVNGAGPLLTIAVNGTGTATLVVGPLSTTTSYTLVNVAYNAPPACTQTVTGSVTINVNATGTWLGFNDNWHDGGNWCGGAIPGATTNVNIPVMGAGLFYPVISAPAEAKDITTAGGATITLANTTLQVYGNITGTNGIDANNGELVFKGASTQTIAGSMFIGKQLRDLTIENNVDVTGTATDSIRISHTLGFGTASGKTFNAGTNNIVLLSSFNSTANVSNTTGNTITGSKFTIERYINTGAASAGNPYAHTKAWQLLSVPTSGTQTINSAYQEGNAPAVDGKSGYGTMLSSPSFPNGFDASAAGAYIKQYIPATDQWNFGPATTTAGIATDRGWMTYIRGDRTSVATPKPTILRTTGSLKTGDVHVSVALGKYDVVGNPYASEIDLRQLTRTGLTNDVYIWDPTLGGSLGFGRYRTATLVGSDFIISPAGTVYPDDVMNMIQSGQAFFVKSNGTPGPEIVFHEAAKTGTSNLVTRGGGAPGRPEYISVNLSSVQSATSSTLLDGSLAVFGDEYSVLADQQDGIKLLNSGENAGFRTGGKYLAVERRPSPQAADTLNLEISTMKVQAYSWQIKTHNMDIPTRSAWLLDNYLGTKTPLALDGSTTINFEVTAAAASASANRFKIIFSKIAGPLPVTFTGISATRNADRTIAVKWSVENEINLEKYTIERSADGVHFTGIVTADVTQSRNYVKNDLSPLAEDNYYRIKATSISGQLQYSAIVKVVPIEMAASISVYPNPVEDKKMFISFVNQRPGSYKLQLINDIGQLMYTGTVKVAGSNDRKQVSLLNVKAAGRYTLNVIAEDGTVSSIKLLVQ